MAKYIERACATDALINNTSLEGYDLEEAVNAICAIPAADVRPVVLCRDCLHYEMGACLKIYDDGAANKDAWQERKPDDFCSCSKKREEKADVA